MIGIVWWLLPWAWLPVIVIFYIYKQTYPRASKKQDIAGDSNEKSPLDNPEENLESNFVFPEVDETVTDQDLRAKQIGVVLQGINRQLEILDQKCLPRNTEERLKTMEKRKLRRRLRSLQNSSEYDK